MLAPETGDGVPILPPQTRNKNRNRKATGPSGGSIPQPRLIPPAMRRSQGVASSRASMESTADPSRISSTPRHPWPVISGAAENACLERERHAVVLFHHEHERLAVGCARLVLHVMSARQRPRVRRHDAARLRRQHRHVHASADHRQQLDERLVQRHRGIAEAHATMIPPVAPLPDGRRQPDNGQTPGQDRRWIHGRGPENAQCGQKASSVCAASDPLRVRTPTAARHQKFPCPATFVPRERPAQRHSALPNRSIDGLSVDT